MDDVAFLKRCASLPVDCTETNLLKAVTSAWDGLIKAERELGVTPGSPPVRLAMPLSAALGAESTKFEFKEPCYALRAPGGCTGHQMMRKLWATVQDYRLASVLVIEGERQDPRLTIGHGDQYGTTLEGLRGLCGVGKDLVSLRSAEHILYLRTKVLEAGINTSKPAGVPIAYDYKLGNRYFDLRNSTRDITYILEQLIARRELSGDFMTDQTSSDFWGRDEYMVGFGWGKDDRDVGLADFGHHHGVQGVICEELNGVGYEFHNDLAESYRDRWAHTFFSTEPTENVTHALKYFYSYASPEEALRPVILLHIGPSVAKVPDTPAASTW